MKGQRIRVFVIALLGAGMFLGDLTASLDFQPPTSSSTAHFKVNPPQFSSKFSKQRRNTADSGDEFEDCSDDYFEMNAANLRDSGAAEWYQNWITINTNTAARQEKYKELGEPGFFAKYAAGTPNFYCSLQKAGCVEKPSCIEIMRHVRRQNPDSSIEEIRATTRQIHFTILEMDATTQLWSIIHDILTAVQANAIGHAGSIVKDFTVQPDEDADMDCEIIRVSISVGVGIILGSVGVAFTGDTQKLITGIVNIVVSAAIPTTYEFEKVVLQMKTIELDRQASRLSTLPYQELRMDQSHAAGMCGALGAGLKDQNFQRTADMTAHIAYVFQSLRSQVTMTFEKVVSNGNALSGSNCKNCTLASWMAHGDWTMAAQRLSNQSYYENIYTQQVREGLISASWASMKNYLKCSCGRKDYKESCKSKYPNAQYRYCPDDKYQCSCQVQGWTHQEHGNHETELLGFNVLEKYGLNITQVLKTTYDNYRKFGNNPPPPMIGPDMALTGAISGLSLPTCASNYIHLSDFDNKKDGGRDWKRHQQFPCTCGNWRSNETEIFMGRIRMGAGQPDMVTERMKETFEQVCPRNFENDKLPPLTRFLAYCQLHIRFPHQIRPSPHSIQVGKVDRHCKQILEETVGMAETQANEFFCTASAAAKEMMDSEHGWADSFVPFPLNHRQKCIDWLEG